MTKPNGEYKIEKGVPVPPHRAGAGAKGQSKYPFGTMNVGDSFTAALPAVKGVHRWLLVNKSSRKFTARREGDGYRIWRVE